MPNWMSDTSVNRVSQKAGGISSSILKGEKLSAIYNSNINTEHSVKTFLTYFGSGNAGAKNELITDYWFIPILDNISPTTANDNVSTPAKNFAKCGFTGYDKGELEYHILNVSIPTYGVETTSYQDITGSYTRPGQSIATATSKTFTIDILNTKSNIVDFVFAQWINEVGDTTWKYPSAPYATCRFTVIVFTPGVASGFPTIYNLKLPFFGVSDKFNSAIADNVSDFFGFEKSTIEQCETGSNGTAESLVKAITARNYTISTYTFNNCYPINIELYQATNDIKTKFTRTVTFAFDTFTINANYPSVKYNSILRNIGGTLLGMGVNVVNKMSAIADNAIGNALDKTIGKVTDKLSSYISKAASGAVGSFNKSFSSGNGKDVKYTFKTNNNVAGIKTSDIKSSDIKRTFQSTF